jgi:hypothetical protein
VGQLGVGEGGVGAADGVGGDRRAGVAQQPQRRDVAWPGLLLVDQGGQHGGDGHGDRDAVARDQVQGPGRVEAGLHDHRRTQPGQAQ